VIINFSGKRITPPVSYTKHQEKYERNKIQETRTQTNPNSQNQKFQKPCLILTA